MNKRFSIFTGLLALLFLCGILHGNEILVNTQEDELYIFNVDENESLKGIQDKLAALTESNSFLIEISSKGRLKNYSLQTSRNQGGYLGYPRNYFMEVTADEKAVIHYIVTTLANKSLIAIALAKNEIEEAGDRIDHLHPLRFLMTVFTDEEMKACIRNIRQRGWLWNHFTAGLKGSLATETNLDNMQEVQILDFAKTVKIDHRLISPSIGKQRWDDFIDLLITHIPRTGDHDRYDT